MTEADENEPTGSPDKWERKRVRFTDEEKEARLDRFGSLEDSVWASCVSCRRKSRGPVCEAYPDGIPEVILNGKVDHKTLYPGDHGLIYLPVSPEMAKEEALWVSA